MTLDEMNAAKEKFNGSTTDTTPMPSRQPRLFDALVAGQDAAALGKVAKTIAAMSPEGQRAALCWLIGYFDNREIDVEE